MSQCRDCGADIKWLRNRTTGRLAPINATPDPTGNIVVNTDGTYSVVGEERRHLARVYRTSHFVTCPAAAARRKPRLFD